MGVCLTSACISLAFARLTQSIWSSLQGSPLLPRLSPAQPSMAQLHLVATICPHPHSQSAPSLDPIRAPAIMSSLIWTCHTSPDTYPRHAVTFCPVGAKKHSGGFLPSLFLSHFACCFILPFLLILPLSLMLSPLTHTLSVASVTFSLSLLSLSLHLGPPAFHHSNTGPMCAHVCVRIGGNNEEKLRQDFDDTSAQSPRALFPRPPTNELNDDDVWEVTVTGKVKCSGES